MTNSIASAKCPSVLSSGNYGLSQNRCTDESKEYVFLKLTDSAYRAIEEYQRNEHAKRFNNGQCAKIQFHGNSGFIHFPTPEDAEGRKFGFSINDVEGSLECIQQTRNELDILGSLAYRVQIQAKDDVYDTTRTKMAIAEETEKSKRIREIKQTDISGRKVKKTVSTTFHQHQQQQQQQQQQHSNHFGGNSGNNNNSSSFISNSSSRSKLVSPLNGASIGGGVGGGASKLVTNSSSSSRSPNPTMLGASGTISSGSKSNRYGSHTSSANLYTQNNAAALPSLTSASSLSSTLAGGIANGYAAASSSHTGSPPDSGVKLSASKASGSGNGNFLNGGANVRNSGNSGPLVGAKGVLGGIKGGGGGSSSSNPSGSKLPDISRRKIRERLIHVLALRPFKKPELYNRLQNEGLRERERNLIVGILKDIATTRDQTYNLRRQMWNDVNENWPYYTEQELQQLKRRKPQNLTPPLSSDAGSSTSGQSPTSTHTGSPPPLVNGSGMSLKRGSLECGDRYDDTFVSGAPPKKQRISRFNKDTVVTGGAPITAIGSSGSYGATRPGGGYGNANSGNSGYALQNRNTAYSPHGSHKATDENSGNSDLSYGVLENADEFMPRIEQSTYHGGTAALGPKTVGSEQSSGKGGVPNAKEKRSSSTASDRSSRNSSSNRELVRKSATFSSSSPTPYGGSFVPESSKSSSSRTVSGNNASGGSYQRQSPNNPQQAQSQQHHKSSNGVIHSPKTHTQASPRENSHGTTRSSSGSRSQQAPVRSSSKSKPAPFGPDAVPFSQPEQHHQQSSHYTYQQQQMPSSSSQGAPSSQDQQQSLPQQPQHQQHPSPTQQIAAAASSYASAATTSSAENARYDFSKYTPIKSIEQRRLYKTEFEKDYVEYRVLLTRLEGVSRRFSGLAEKLQNVRQGCPDYDRIKQQIVFEYERISKEKQDKLRFDYLHQKLAYIKQLVTDYDKTLTAAATAAAQQLQQQQQLHTNSDASNHADAVETHMLTSRNHSRLSPMVSGSDNSNTSPPIPYHHQQQHYQQHHDAETIHHQQPPQQQQHQHHPAVAHSEFPPSAEQQHYNGHHHLSNHNQSNSHNNDSDTDDSSNSNSNDDDDDDDDDSNSNSNDDDDDTTSIYM